MEDVRPFVAIVLGQPLPRDADQLALAAGAAAVLRPGLDTSAGPQTAVVIDPADAPDPAGLRDVVQRLLTGLADLDAVCPGICVVAAHPVTDTLKVVDESHLLLGTADRDDYRWVGAPVAGPLAVLAAAADEAGAGAAGAGELLAVLIEQGQQVRAVRA